MIRWCKFQLNGAMISDERCEYRQGYAILFSAVQLQERSIISKAKQHDQPWHHRYASQEHFLR